MGGRDAQPKAAAMQALVRTLTVGFIFDMTSFTDFTYCRDRQEHRRQTAGQSPTA